MSIIQKETWYVQTQLTFLILLIIYVFGSITYQGNWSVRTPELFGEGTLYLLNIDDKSIGYIDAWGEWIIYGSKEECSLVQISGDRINDVHGSVSCSMHFRDNNFRGSIYFRGQDRPFCGAISIGKFPAKCKE